MRGRISEATDRLLKARTSITFAVVARDAQVSRTFLYENPQARAAVDAAIAQAAGRRVESRRDAAEALEAGWRERALNAEDALKATHEEIRAQRRQIGELLGQVRDMATPWQQHDLVRITTQNAELSRQVKELGTENRSLQERLSASRDNARFTDRRLAELEAELLETRDVASNSSKK
jgi:chromosome segregation ATPase